MDYFARHGAPCPQDINPAEHIIDVVQGKASGQIDWVETWIQSEDRKMALAELESLNETSRLDPSYVEDTADYVTSHWFQFVTVSKRLTVQIWRSPVCDI